MTILGIIEGHNASAALLIDGEIVAAASEERFTHLKNENGYPKKAIDFCLSFAEISPAEIDEVVFSTIGTDIKWNSLRNEALFSVEDHLREQYDFYKPVIIDQKPVDEIMPRYINQLIARKGYTNCGYDIIGKKVEEMMDIPTMQKIRKQTVSKHLGITEEKIRFMEHHSCHTYLAYFSAPERKKDMLIATFDSSGDFGINITLNIANKEGIKRIFESTNFQFGRIYKYITLLLGMKPHDHEYKVMGLAPYGNEKDIAKSFPVFDEIEQVKGLEFKWGERPKDLYFHFRDRLEGHRFDGIAGALQKKLELLIIEWLQNAINKTKIHTVALGGGVAMNIKLGLQIAKIPAVKKIYVGPSPADESNAIGACYGGYYEYCKRSRLDYRKVPQLKDVYLGSEFDYLGFLKLVKARKEKYRVTKGMTDEKVAKMLKDGLIVARCIGRMEFGARALGNRSILADPSKRDSVRKINRQIKHRDFWMPFAPSILEEDMGRYLVNPKNLRSDYMTMGFETKLAAHRDLIAALHPEDLSARPQIVKRDQNPAYYNLISAFKKLSGIGGLLNTSFNLHGYPVVCTPEDALFVLDNSELEHIYINNHLVSKKNANRN